MPYIARMLTLTAKSQLTLKKSVMAHLGAAPGDKLSVEMLPDGRVALRLAKPAGAMEGFIGSLAKPGQRRRTQAEIAAAIADGWAGSR